MSESPPKHRLQLTALAVSGAVALAATGAAWADDAASTQSSASSAPTTQGLTLDPFQTLVYDPLFAISKPLGNFDPIGQYIKEPLQNKIPQLSIKGYIQNITEVTTTSNRTLPNGGKKDWTLQKEEWRFNLDTKYHVNDAITVGSVFAFQYDGIYGWQSSDGLNANKLDQDAEYYSTFDRVARELWVQYNDGPVSLKVGRQQIVWGKTDGKILDIIDPDDGRDGPAYGQSDYEWRRIPLTAVNATYRLTDSTIVQGVWVPEFRPARGVLYGSPYYPSDGTTIGSETPNDAPAQFSLEDSAGGGRVDTNIGALTLSGIYYYGFDYSGVAGRRNGGQDFIHYARTNNVGFAADYATKILGQDLTLRSEAIYINGLQAPIGVNAAGDSIWDEKDKFKLAVAAETNIGPADNRYNLLFQPLWFHTFDHGGDTLIYVTSISHSVRSTGDRLSFDATFYPMTVNSVYQGLGVNVGASWRFSQWITARLYYWNFSGPSDSYPGTYGSFDKSDVIGLSMKYEF